MRLNELKPLCGKGWLRLPVLGSGKLQCQLLKNSRAFSCRDFSGCPDFDAWGVAPLNKVACPAL